MTKRSPPPRSSAIVLVYPSTGFDFGLGLAPPHSVLALAAYLEGRVPHRVAVIDQRVEPAWRERLEAELDGRPLLLGISAMTGVQLKHALALARIARGRSPTTPIVFGGVHVSLLPEQTLASPLVDLGVVGEGEAPLLALIGALEGAAGGLAAVPGLAWKDGPRVVVNPKSPPLDFGELPTDRFRGVDVERYVREGAGVLRGRELDLGETSRGCPRRCGYCYNTVFHAGRWRARPAAEVVAMLREQVAAHRLDSVWLRDDNFFVDVDRAAAIVEAAAESGVSLYLPGMTIQEFRRLPSATLRTLGAMRGALVRFGVESGSDAVLRAIDKGITAAEVYDVNRACAALGVVPSYNFMIGFPGETRADVLATVRMMKRLKRENPAAQLNAVNLYTPYPGTALYERFRREAPEAVPAAVEGWATFHHLNVKRGGLSRVERRFYENVAVASYVLSDAFAASLSRLQRLLLLPLRAWFAARWRLDAFAVAPEVLLLRRLKRLLLAID